VVVDEKEEPYFDWQTWVRSVREVHLTLVVLQRQIHGIEKEFSVKANETLTGESARDDNYLKHLDIYCADGDHETN